MAIINVSPDTDITALVASAEVSGGDVLLLAKGTYNQTVIISKNYVRIVSKDCGAVFDGVDTLANAFTLNGVTGAEIHGVVIRNYLNAGISVIDGTANRIICNIISDITEGGRGITFRNSSANFIWYNQIGNVFDGVFLSSGSANNWVMSNASKDCSHDGFESFLAEDRNNAFIGNIAVDCGGNCFEIFGDNNLAYRNTAIGAAGVGYLFSAGDNTLAVENRAEKCADGARVNTQNVLVAGSEFKNNSGTGLEVLHDFNIILKNLIAFNKDSGLVAGPYADYNFIYYNKVICNTPEDITEGGNRQQLSAKYYRMQGRLHRMTQNSRNRDQERWFFDWMIQNGSRLK